MAVFLNPLHIYIYIYSTNGYPTLNRVKIYDVVCNIFFMLMKHIFTKSKHSSLPCRNSTVAVSLIITDVYVQRMNMETNLIGCVQLQRPDLEKHL